jgi:hypothetical protein
VTSRRFNFWKTVLWLILTPVAFVLGWLESIQFVSLLSIWALVETSWAAYRADVPTEPTDA